MKNKFELSLDEKQRYSVNLTMIYNLTVEVEAASNEEAIELVKDNKEKFAPDSRFIKGEKTVDFAELLND